MSTPTRLRLLAGALVAAALAVTPLTAVAQTPVGDSPNGRVITLVDTSAQAGGSIRFTGTGYVNDGGTGQTVTVKLNDTDVLGTFEAAPDGAITGTVAIPAGLSPGGAYWLRFLAGAGKPDDMPSSSLHVEFSIVGAPAPATTTVAAAGAAPSAPQGSSGQSGDLVSSGDEMTRNLAVAALLAAVGVAGLGVDRVLGRRRRAATADALGSSPKKFL